MPKNIVLALVLVVVLSASVPAIGANDAVFSTSANQYIETPDGGRTIQHAALQRARTWIESFGATFLPNHLGLDAVDVLVDGRILFSTADSGLAAHADGLIALAPDRVYIFDPASGMLSPALDWNPAGIDLGPLDGLDRLDEGRYAFSVEELRQVQDADGWTVIYPENIYMIDAVTGLLSTIFNGRDFGLSDLDAVHVYGDGRVAFSTAHDCFVITGNGGRKLDHESVYIHDAGNLTTALDGSARAVFSTDAVDLGETDVWISLDRERISWGTFAVAQGFDLVRGDVRILLETAGDFSDSITECLAANTSQTEFAEGAIPEPGSGWFYLTRRRPIGSWETFGPGQSAPRIAIDELELCQ